jgi:peptide/nickel transport system substrate-binding protein
MAQEPDQLSLKPVGQGHVYRAVTRMLNANLAYVDDQNAFHAELAEALPQFGSPSWQVFPDGQMETTFRLKANLTWHDGVPFTADDFVFAHRVYTSPELGQANSDPQKKMKEIVASDPRTLVIRWREPYPGADTIMGVSPPEGTFVPLPRHILDAAFQQGNPEAFIAHAFWASAYVGLGPFRLDKWDQGSSLEVTAFDGYVLGQPKIDRIRVIFVRDANTVVANMLAGAADVVAENTLRTEQGQLLRQDWEGRGAGIVKFFPGGGRRADIQLDPTRVNPQALLDVRVRQALISGIDREVLNQTLTDGLGGTIDTWAPPNLDYFPAVDRAIKKYPYNPQLTSQLLEEAGFKKGADGIYADPAGARLSLEMKYQADPQYDKEGLIMADSLKGVGVEVFPMAVPEAQRTDRATTVDFRALRTQGGGAMENLYGTSNVPTAENRYTGNNRGAWSNADYDRLQQAFNVTLDRAQRSDQIVQMARVVSEQVPMIPLYYKASAVAYVPQLKGVIAGDMYGAFWNEHLWEIG